ncbi:putative reverse transcriptase domain-containing protein [Tanacetum coccineum]
MEMVFGISECAEARKAQLCPEMVPTERKKIEAYIRGLTDNIKGTVIGSKHHSLNEAVSWDMHCGTKGSRFNRKECRVQIKENGKVTSVITTAGHIARDCKGKAIATGANARPTVMCYDSGEKARMVIQELVARRMKKRSTMVRKLEARAYVIKATDKHRHYVTETEPKENTIGRITSDLRFPEVKNRNPHLRIATCRSTSRFHSVYSNIDPASGYHQLQIREEDIPITAFQTRSVQFPRSRDNNKGGSRGSAKVRGYPNCLHRQQNPKEVRQFLGLAEYYRRFIEGFSLISKPLTKLTEKNKKYEWGTEEDEAFQTLKQKLCSAPILALPEGTENFVVYYNASHKGYGAILMQRENVIANRSPRT